MCEKVGTKAVCKCKKNFELEEDGKSCEQGQLNACYNSNLMTLVQDLLLNGNINYFLRFQSILVNA